MVRVSGKNKKREKALINVNVKSALQIFDDKDLLYEVAVNTGIAEYRLFRFLHYDILLSKSEWSILKEYLLSARIRVDQILDILERGYSNARKKDFPE